MVGLSVVLEGQKSGFDKKTPQVINKATLTTMMFNNNKPPSPCSTSISFHKNCSQFCFPAPTFLEECSLCRQKLLPGKDIYMYKGDRAFCSEECRCRQIFMDEEETLRKEYCSFAAMKPTPSSSSSTTATTDKTASSTSDSRHRNSGRNRPGGFAY